jgi:hypothetical protein
MAAARSIHYVTDRESLLADELRSIAVETIKAQPAEDVQALLGLARSGLSRLLADTRWDLKTAFRVLDCLNVPVVEALVASANTGAKR